MNIKLSLAPLAPLAALALCALPLVAGCAADTSDVPAEETEATEDELVRSRVQEGTFKLYSDPDAVPGRHCDVYTKLDLVNDRGGRAKLMEDLAPGSLCRLAVFPNEREYRLRQTGTDCGSKIYEGSRRFALGPATTGFAKIKITDHRTRMCRDLVPAQIIVEETGQQKKYSYDGAPNIQGSFPSGGEHSLSGKLFNAMKNHALSANSETAKYVQAVGGSTVTFEKDGNLAQCTASLGSGGLDYSCRFDIAAGALEWTNSSDSIQAELHEAIRVATNGGAIVSLRDTNNNGVRCEGRTLGMIQVMSYRCDVTFQQ